MPTIFVVQLVLITNGQRVLLGKKKRGFGHGYFNGFGGKVEAGESVRQAAARELLEEAGISADAMAHRGVLTFVFDDKPQPWEVHVFHACEHAGAPVETDEMAPQWFAFDSIPYHSMWADDPLWYPLVLRGGARFRGTFHFKDTHTLVWHELAEVAQLEEPP